VLQSRSGYRLARRRVGLFDLFRLSSGVIPISQSARVLHESWLLHVTQIPTAAGREFRVIDWIKNWAAERPMVELRADAAGNLDLRLGGRAMSEQRPVYFTAHLDHPAFVVERIVAPSVLDLTFRGGVMDEYFKNAAITVYDHHDQPHAARLTGKANPADEGSTAPKQPLQHYLAELDEPENSVDVSIGDSIRPGDVAVWALPPAEILDGLIHTQACDDLAAVAAALAALDVLMHLPEAASRDVRLLFTRAEEVGFIGAIAACRPASHERTMPMNARVIALENSRSFPADSPIGGGPIVRVGDRLTVFTPSLTEAVARRAEQVAGGPASVTASQKASEAPAWKWQRKLMTGGACEASVYCAAGYEATCVCLALGNYHNMADLTAVQAGTNTSRAKIGREFVSIADFHGMVDLLVACGLEMPEVGFGQPAAIQPKLDKLWKDLGHLVVAR